MGILRFCISRMTSFCRSADIRLSGLILMMDRVRIPNWVDIVTGRGLFSAYSRFLALFCFMRFRARFFSDMRHGFDLCVFLAPLVVVHFCDGCVFVSSVVWPLDLFCHGCDIWVVVSLADSWLL